MKKIEKTAQKIWALAMSIVMVLSMCVSHIGTVHAASQPATISGKAYVKVRENVYGQTAVFDVTIDGKTYTGYCLTPTRPCPLDGEYSYTGVLQTSGPYAGAYKITVDSSYTTNSKYGVHESDWAHLKGNPPYLTQNVGNFYIYRNGSLSLKKSSAAPEITDGNNCYSLAGAEYGVYSDYGCTSQVGTLTTYSDGSSSSIELDEGTYYVKELAAPKGFKMDTDVHSVTVSAGEEAVIYVTDVPGNDPIAVEITKITEGNEYITEIPSLAKTQFTIKYYDGFYDEKNLPSEATREWVIETKDVNGKCFAWLSPSYVVAGDELYTLGGRAVIPLGTISIEETKPAPGYTLTGGYLKPDGSSDTTSGRYVAQIVESQSTMGTLVGGNKFTVANHILRGGIAVQKYDSELNTAQGTATLAGAEFTIRNATGATITVDGTQYKDGEVVTTLTTDETGYAATARDLLPYGDYEVEETKAPNGYQLAGKNVKQTVTVDKENTLITASSTYDDVIRGGLTVQKSDADVDAVQGAASLAGAVIEVRNANTSSVYVNGKTYAQGETVLTLTTDETGKASTDSAVLPYGNYEVEETKAPNGYQLSGKNLKQKVTISKQSTVITLEKIYDKVIRGGIAVQKTDLQSGAASAQGAATLAGAEFTIRNANVQPVYVNGKSYAKGETILTLTTDENGKASTDSAVLPYGDYEVEETKAPEGYVLEGENLKQVVTVTAQGVTVSAAPTKDRVVRGDFELHKIEHYTRRVMANVEFKITSKTTGESHVIRTDADGYYSTSASYASHTAENGVWFSMDANGNVTKSTDEMGALPYDTYTIEELRCEANETTDLYTGEFVIDADGKVIDLGVIEDYERSIRTTAKGADSDDNFVTPDGKVVIVDSVYYQGLFVGETYTAEGVLMDKETGEPVLDANGNEITASTTFVPEEREGTVDVKFAFDGSALGGTESVVFETVYNADGTVAAEHKDIEDKDQTVFFPEIHTTISDENGYQSVYAGPVVLTDVVSYKGVEPGVEYVMNGVLMDKETGEPVLDADGNQITASTTFTPEEKEGTVEVVFSFDATVVAGKTLVAYEEMTKDEKTYAVHADIEDEAQTVYIPVIHTTATSETGEKNFVSNGTATVIDTITYKNLTPGETYIARGILMDKQTEKPLLVNGKEVISEKEFTPETSDGTVKVGFEFDASSLGSAQVVVYEEVYQVETPETPDGEEEIETPSVPTERLVADHKDITDEGQTVTFNAPPKTGDFAGITAILSILLGFIGFAILFTRKKAYK